MAPIQLVCFDIGGVMVRLVTGWRDAVNRARLHDHLDLDLDRIEQAMPDHHPLMGALETGSMTEEAYLKQAAALFRMPVDAMRAIFDAWLIEPYPGLDALIDQLHAADVWTACLSNTSVPHWRIMHDPDSGRYLPLKRLHHRFASFEVGVMKPDGRIYAHVEEVAAVHPASIVFFDDSEPNVAAAQARGWQACRIDPAGDPVAQMRGWLRSRGVLA